MSSSISFRILGPVEACVDGSVLPVTGRVQVKLLAVLVVHANRAVSSDRLIDMVWGPSGSGSDNRLQMAIARLRRALAPLAADDVAVIRTVPGGYLLASGAGAVDAEEFASGLQNARRALAAGDPEQAVALLDRALSLWRGPPLVEVAFEDFAQSEIRRFEELRLVALEARAEAKLQLGRHAELVAELQMLVEQEPAREQLTGQLMRALYGCGRQTAALEAYQRLRVHLATEVGLEPEPALRDLQNQILHQSAELERPASERSTAHAHMPRRAEALALPSGTVTFLFSDIEGSTRLVIDRGNEQYGAVLERHREQVRTVLATHSGVEVATEGDAFFVAFARASDALGAASAIQHASSEGPVRVRVGIHTGEALIVDDDYVGLDVHKAARICAAAHGGQVLVSRATRDLAGGGLRDLGVYRLKDLTAPERLFQLGETEFPPLRTLRQTNLPVQPTLLLGRQQELTELLGLAASARLLTLTGPGGTGKTRLALQLAAHLSDRFRDGAWWVPLAAVSDPAVVLSTIAQHVGARGDLREHLADRHMVLLLDNLEQVLDAAPLIADLIRSLPDLSVITTSRERLAVSGEQEYPVAPLNAAAAEELFTARARQLHPDFQPDEAVRELCDRLDRLPLAIELAASRVKLMTPAQILSRLGRRLDLLEAGPRDAPTRQRTMRAAIGWSHDLLSQPERTLFRRLGVFPGSFDLDAAEAICDADLDDLQSLVEKSLLRNNQRGRFFLLETTREYALEQLDGVGELAEMRRHHADWFLDLGDQAGRRIGSIEQGRWFRRLDDEVDNLRAALAWAMRHDLRRGIELASTLLRPWRNHGRLTELIAWLEPALNSGHIESATRVRALNTVGEALNFVDDFDRARPILEESLRLSRASGDKHAEAFPLRLLGMLEANDGSIPEATRLLEAALAIYRDAGDRANIARTTNLLGDCYLEAGEVDLARGTWEEAVAVATAIGDATLVAHDLGFLGDLALHLNEPDQAESHYRRALEIDQELGDERNDIYSLAGLACAAALKADLDTAGRLWAVAEAAERRIGTRMLAAERARYERIIRPLYTNPTFQTGQRAAQDTALADAVAEILAE